MRSVQLCCVLSISDNTHIMSRTVHRHTEVSGRVTAVFDRPMLPKSRLIFVLPTRTHSDCISELLKDTAQERCWPSRTEQRRQALLCHVSYTPLIRITLYSPAVTIRTTSLTYVLPTQYIFVSEQTAIISQYSIDWLVFITETECVYCAVRSTFYVLLTQCIYVFCVDLRTNSDYFTVQH